MALAVGLVSVVIGWAVMMGIGLMLREMPEWMAATLVLPAGFAFLGAMAFLWYKMFFGLARMLNVRL